MKHAILFPLTCMLCMYTAFAQPVIKISGPQDTLAVRSRVIHYLDYLDVRENIIILIFFSSNMLDNLKGVTYCLNSSGPSGYQVIRVIVDARLSKRQQELVLAHEMIHVRQLAKGELIITGKQQLIWKGRKYHFKYDGLQPMPWENEAYKADKVLTKLYKKQLETSLIASRLLPDKVCRK